MDTRAKRKWVIAAVILLVAAALGAACMNVWQDRSFQNKGKGYVAVIRIDGPIYGGAGSESVLNSSEGVSSEDLMRQFQAARKDPQAKAILVRINSPGGSVTAGMAIYDTMQYIKPQVRTVCIGMAASMGAFLLMAGQKGKRCALPNSEVMIHQPLGGAQGQATDVQIQAEWLLKTKEKMIRMKAEMTGQDIERIRRDVERDHFMSAQEALEYGIIDEIFDPRKKTN